MITLYTKSNCTYCDQAKALLRARDADFEEVHLDEGQEKEARKQYITKVELLQRIPSARTMPQIMEDGALIGGYTELKKLLG